MLRTRYASRVQRKALSTIDWMLSSQASDVINQFHIHRLRTADPVGGGTWQFAKRDTWEHGTKGRSQTTLTRFWLFFWPPTALGWHFLWYERWQEMDISGPPTYLFVVCEWPQRRWLGVSGGNPIHGLSSCVKVHRQKAQLGTTFIPPSSSSS